MSNQALSQEEIDALFTGDAEPAPVADRVEPEARLYDFRRPARVSKDRQRTLEGMYGTLAKSLEGWLVGRVRSQVDVHLKGVEQLTFGEFVLSLPEPCTSFVFNVGEPGGPQAVVDLGRDFAFYAVERFLGAASASEVPSRALTVLERRVVRIIAERLAGQIRDMWADHADMDLELARFEAVPDMLQAANREDSMLVANLETRFQGLTSSILICLPFAVLDDFFAAATAGGGRTKRGASDPADRNAIATNVRRAHVPISVRLPFFDLTFREITELRPGGTLVTGIPRSSPARVEVGGRTRYTGFVGMMSDVLAVQILDEVETDEERP